MAMFQRGDLVLSARDEQGLKKGKRYTVKKRPPVRNRTGRGRSTSTRVLRRHRHLLARRRLRVFDGRLPQRQEVLKMNPDYIPCLNVKQPWAELIACGRKVIELRTWRTNYRGLLVIVASLKRAPPYPEVDGPRGEAVALVQLEDIRVATPGDVGAACCPPSPGEFAWCLGFIRRLPAGLKVKGQLHTYAASEEIVRAIQGT